MRLKNHLPLLMALLAPTTATALALLPLLIDYVAVPAEMQPDNQGSPPIVFLVIPFMAGPIVAFLVNWRWLFARTDNRASLAALPQFPVAVLMMMLAVKLEYRGFHLEDSGEEAMSYGLGLFMSAFFGLIVGVLVALAGHIGYRMGSSRLSAASTNKFVNNEPGA